MALKNKKIIVTCGPTCVPIDDMRVMTNMSTGQLGQRLAQGLNEKGARVTLLEGPVAQPLASKRIKIKKFYFYQDLEDLLKKELKPSVDIVIHAAAVSDYQPEKRQTKKITSGRSKLRLTFVPTKKIIHLFKKRCPQVFLVGFKLESPCSETFLVEKGYRLLKDAPCDLVVANTVKKRYKACIINPNGQVVARAASKNILVQKLIQTLESD